MYLKHKILSPWLSHRPAVEKKKSMSLIRYVMGSKFHNQLFRISTMCGIPQPPRDKAKGTSNSLESVLLKKSREETVPLAFPKFPLYSPHPSRGSISSLTSAVHTSHLWVGILLFHVPILLPLYLYRCVSHLFLATNLSIFN